MQNTSQSSILSENLAYWTGRAAGYSEVNQTELTTSQKEKWSRCLRSEISRRFPGIPPERLRGLLTPKDTEAGNNIALWSINKRTILHHGAGCGLTVESEQGVGTTVRITVPFERFEE